MTQQEKLRQKYWAKYIMKNWRWYLHNFYWHLGRFKIFSLETRIGRWMYDQYALPSSSSAALLRADEDFKAGRCVKGSEIRKRINKKIEIEGAIK